MLKNEHRSQFESLLNNQTDITRQLRACVIDWVFEIATKIKIEDKSVVYQAICLMDRFYELIKKNLPPKDL
jgi:hypothetical protein